MGSLSRATCTAVQCTVALNFCLDRTSEEEKKTLQSYRVAKVSLSKLYTVAISYEHLSKEGYQQYPLDCIHFHHR